MSLLAGQTAVITGGAQGLGFAIAEQFIAEAPASYSVTSISTPPRRRSPNSVVPTSPVR